jgi:hypothetical protein
VKSAWNSAFLYTQFEFFNKMFFGLISTFCTLYLQMRRKRLKAIQNVSVGESRFCYGVWNLNLYHPRISRRRRRRRKRRRRRSPRSGNGPAPLLVPAQVPVQAPVQAAAVAHVSCLLFSRSLFLNHQILLPLILQQSKFLCYFTLLCSVVDPRSRVFSPRDPGCMESQ